MSAYVNIPGAWGDEEVKADWFKAHATKFFLTAPAWDATPEDQFIVCVVLNRDFSAAGIAYSRVEYDRFNSDDGRQHYWFYVPKDDLYANSDLESWHPRGTPVDNTPDVPPSEDWVEKVKEIFGDKISVINMDDYE